MVMTVVGILLVFAIVVEIVMVIVMVIVIQSHLPIPLLQPVAAEASALKYLIQYKKHL